MIQQSSYTKERGIKIIDLLFTIILKWRSMAIAAILCALILGGYSYYISKESINLNVVVEDKDSLKLENLTIKDYEDYLDKQAWDKINDVVDYDIQIAEQQKYNKNSIITKIHAVEEYSGTIQYYVDNHFQYNYAGTFNNNNINSIVAYYKNAKISSDLLSFIAKKVGIEDEESYLFDVMDVTSDDTLITFTVAYYNKKACNEILDVIDDFMKEYYKNAAKVFGEHDLICVSKKVSIIANMLHQEMQKANIEEVNNMQGVRASYYSLLAEDEIAYYKYTNNEISEEKALTIIKNVLHMHINSDGTVTTQQSNTLAATKNTNTGVSKKYILVGFLLGIFMTASVASLQYILNNRIHNEEELEHAYGLTILGVVKRKEKRRFLSFIDMLIINIRDMNKRKFSSEEAVSMAAAGAKLFASKAGISKLYLTGCAISSAEEDIMEKMKSIVSNGDVMVSWGKDPLYNMETREALLNSEGVVLVETVGKSMMNEIQKEIDICINNNINIIGVVTIK